LPHELDRAADPAHAIAGGDRDRPAGSAVSGALQ
jgi:hypothetical protein